MHRDEEESRQCPCPPKTKLQRSFSRTAEGPPILMAGGIRMTGGAGDLTSIFNSRPRAPDSQTLFRRFLHHGDEGLFHFLRHGA
jgi:hypothetical protein